MLKFQNFKRTGFVLAVVYALFHLACDPGKGVQVQDDPDTTGQVDTAEDTTGEDTTGTDTTGTDTVVEVEDPVEITTVPAIAFLSWPSSILTDTVTTLSVGVLDSITFSQPLNNIEINLSARPFAAANFSDTSGTLTKVYITDDNGIALFNIAPTEAGEIEIIVVIEDSTDNVILSESRFITVSENIIEDEIFKQMAMEIEDPVINADGISRSDIKVIVKDDQNHPIIGEEVEFSATGGTIVKTATTDSTGIATGWIISEKRNTSVIVTARLNSNGEFLTDQQTIIFSGVNLNVSAQFNVMKVDGVDTLVFSLKDAAQKPITRDTLIIKLSNNAEFENSGEDSLKVVTDAFGNYQTWISSSTEQSIQITASALGATGTNEVVFTSNRITFTASSNSIKGDGVTTSTITATVVDGSSNAISGAEVKWATNFGSFSGNPIRQTNSQGQTSITLVSPKGVGDAVVSVEIKENGSLIASDNHTIKIIGLTPERVNLSISPNNIAVNVGKAILTARVYDEHQNVINDVLVGFKMVKSAGAGDESMKSPISYTQLGAASTEFTAGSVISQYQSVKFTAVVLDIEGTDTTELISSDTVSLTISGPPHFVSLGHNIEQLINNEDGTYELPVAAVVTDVNGNLVADDTPVNFSKAASNYYARPHESRQWDPRSAQDELGQAVRKTYELDELTLYRIIDIPFWYNLHWTDYNNNEKLDPGEDETPLGANPGTLPYRGEDRDGNGIINKPPETFIDINGDGRWNSGIGGDIAEPLIPDHDTLFADYNGNGIRDTAEVIVNDNGDGICQCVGTTDSNGDIYEYDFEGGTDKSPLPYGLGGGLPSVILTKDGSAKTKIVYVQSEALAVGVRLTAEANGREAYDTFRLPIVEGAGQK